MGEIFIYNTHIMQQIQIGVDGVIFFFIYTYKCVTLHIPIYLYFFSDWSRYINIVYISIAIINYVYSRTSGKYYESFFYPF